MNCEICKRDGELCSNLYYVPCNPIDGIREIFICDKCDVMNYFQMNSLAEIRLFPKKGYTFDYSKENDKERSFIKTKNKTDEYISINWKEALKIKNTEDDDYVKILYEKIEFWNENELDYKIISKKDQCLCDSLAEKYLLIPKKEFFDFKEKELEKQQDLLKEWKESLE